MTEYRHEAVFVSQAGVAPPIAPGKLPGKLPGESSWPSGAEFVKDTASFTRQKPRPSVNPVSRRLSDGVREV
jgi:hypothetical protein